MKKSQNIKMNKLLIGALLSTISFVSMAQQSNSVGSLTHIGEPKSTIYNQKELRGFANELPLVTVMKQITPNGWIVKKNDSEDNRLDIKKLVSWQGGKNWVETLDKLAKDYEFNVSLDWNKQVIVLSNTPKKEVVEVTPPAKKGLFVLEGSDEDKKMTDVAVGASEQATSTPETKVAEMKVEENKVAEVAPEIKVTEQKEEVKVVPTWNIETTKSLKDNVAIWAEAAGYRLVWTAEDYPVGISSSIVGEFDSENGPIKQLSVDYGPDSRVQVPLSFQFFQNKTLVVENWMFEQNGRPQYTKKD